MLKKWRRSLGDYYFTVLYKFYIILKVIEIMVKRVQANENSLFSNIEEKKRD